MLESDIAEAGGNFYFNKMINLLRSLIILFLSCLVFITNAQEKKIPLAFNIIIKQDTVTRQVLTSLNSFIAQKDKAAKENSYILKSDLLEATALLDEMKGIGQNQKLQDPNFYKPVVTNLTKLNDGQFIIQLSYIGVSDNTPAISASFKWLAKLMNGRVYFYSPLKQNTAGWRTKKKHNITFYYKDKLDRSASTAFSNYVAFYDRKLNTVTKPIEHYYCDNFSEAQQLLGLEYCAAYAGMLNNNLTANEGGRSLIINGWNSGGSRFDPHDLFHDRLRTVMNSDVINRPVDEGAAYLYGGSWGKSKEEVISLFFAYARTNPNADWKQLYIDGVNYSNDNGKILKISYAINALLISKIEKEKGFQAVMDLLACGKKEKGDENYFIALNKISGITKESFNAEVWKLIKTI